MITSLLFLTVAFLAAILDLPLWLRISASLLTGLLLIRMFVLYHDYMHNAIFYKSMIPGMLLSTFGHLLLTPPSVWKRSHDHHHRNNSKIWGASIGSFPVMTLQHYRVASLMDRLKYRFSRSTIVIVLGYFTVFLFGMCIRPMLVNPHKHLDSLLAVGLHFGSMYLIYSNFGGLSLLLGFIFPLWISTTIGTYLFYVQHNFPGTQISGPDSWTYSHAALRSSSYLEMGSVMNWFTGNIGFHHVHHLNSKIPFYRLAEAMAALHELQSPAKTSLRIRDIYAALRLKLWDTDRGCFVSFSGTSLTTPALINMHGE